MFDKRFTKLFAFTVMQVQKVVIEGQSSDTDPSKGSDQYNDENGRENAHHSHYQGEHAGHISRGTRQLQHYFVVLFFYNGVVATLLWPFTYTALLLDPKIVSCTGLRKHLGGIQKKHVISGKAANVLMLTLLLFVSMAQKVLST